jgi:O-antigen ligase
VFIYIALIIDVVLAVVFKKFENEKKGIAPKIKVVGVIYAIMLGLGAVLLVVYVILNTKGMAGSLSSSNSYLYFDEYWGNNRGLTWISAVNAMKQAASADPVRLLIGAGPDQFNAFVYEYCGAEMEARWSAEGVVFGNAHNEWLSELITLGFIGGISYIGVFISSLVLFLKKSEKTPELLIPAMCIVAYMAHGFFCYQLILSTPAIFIIMGLGVQLAYQGKAFFRSITVLSEPEN